MLSFYVTSFLGRLCSVRKEVFSLELHFRADVFFFVRFNPGCHSFVILPRATNMSPVPG